MSISRHHAEWLSLTETSGPFLSLPILLRVFPQELDALDSGLTRRLRLAFDEWEESQEHRTPDSAIHNAWIRFVLTEVLGFPGDEVLVEGQSIPDSLRIQVPAHVERLKPDMVVVVPSGEPDAGTPRLLIANYARSQNLNHPVDGRAWKASPAARMADLLRGTGVKVGLVTNGEQWMLVSNCTDTVGYASWFASLWREEPLTLRAFQSLLGVRRFFGVASDDTLTKMLEDSATDQTDVTDQLGYQVRKAVEVLVQAIDRIDKDRGRTLLYGTDEKQLYEASLTTMMRLVFLFSAEERGLLPLDDDLYNLSYAASTLRAQLREAADQSGEEVLERRCDAWSRLLATFRAVYGGVQHEAMRLPAYGGNLFDPDRFSFLEGRAAGTSWRDTPAQPLPIHNRTVLHLLEALQILQVKVPGGGPAEARRLSFRALDIEQIGHVYEGLLDHTAVRAEEPVLGLTGTKDREPEVPLSRLEELLTKGSSELIKFLQEATGRSTSALTKALAAGVGLDNEHDLHIACDNDDALYVRVMPFVGLLRPDTLGYPVVITKGSVYVTAGTDRRSTGTHYTPRSLTAPIVKRTLDPLLYKGMADGDEPSADTLRSPREILALKVCDMTTGSGAFLVQASRYMSERLVEAWEFIEEANPDMVLVTPEGGLSHAMPHERLIPADPEERLVIARRLIVDRCLYGVDKNPMAVEMAKLSLWLTTMEKQRPFTFLDHAIKCGDSLVGVDMAQLHAWSLDRKASDALGIFTDRSITDALEYRLLLEQMDERSIADVNEKARLHAMAEKAMTRAKLAADLIVAPALYYLKPGDQKKERERLRASYVALDPAINDPLLRAQADKMLGDVKPFHWPLEFPEVFRDGADAGFDAIVGNPPFIGGQRITGQMGVPYREYLVNIIGRGVKGSADIVAYFHLRGFDLVRPGGIFGLIATNTLAQGDTRQVGLDQIIAEGGQIIDAIPSMPWPGAAALEVVVTTIYRGHWNACRRLAGRCVEQITAFLDDGSASGNPVRLKENAGKAFQGSIVLGMGFVLEPEEAQALIDNDPRNAEVLFPYLNGEDLNSRPDQSPSRWVINFGEMSEDQARKYPGCWRIVEANVKPERIIKDAKKYPRMVNTWWRFWCARPELAEAITELPCVIVTTRVSAFHFINFADTNIVFSDRLAVITLNQSWHFALLSSTLHENWAHRPGITTHETRPTYNPEESFQTFPFPYPSDSQHSKLNRMGEAYREHRRVLMLARQIGLTKAYNLFHNPSYNDADIAELRRLHSEMDIAVRDAYGWGDLDLGHDFYGDGKETRFALAPAAKQEVLRRLLKLNHERAAEESAVAAAVKPVKKPKKGKATDTGQITTDDLMIEAIVADKEAHSQKQIAIRDEDIEPGILTWLVARQAEPELVERHRSQPVVRSQYKPTIKPLKSVRLAKEEYGLQEMVGVPVGAAYERKTWGPLSTSFRDGVGRAEALGWLVKTSDRHGDSYSLGPNASEGIQIAAQVIGERGQQVEDLLKYVDGDPTDEAERQMTVHKVWADLKAEGLTATPDAVVKAVQEWKPERRGFSVLEIKASLQDLKNRGWLNRFPPSKKYQQEQG